MLAISAITVLPAYFSSAAYLFKMSVHPTLANKYFPTGRIIAIITSVISLIFCGFMLYASDIRYVALTPLLLTLGLPLFVWAKKAQSSTHIFTTFEKYCVGILLILDVLVLVLFFKGILVI